MICLIIFSGRTKDVKDAVRKVAFEVLSEKVKIKSLTIAQRLMLLESGLNDRSMLVKKACTAKLLKAWLIDLNNQVPDLVKCLHVESSPESSVLTLKALFESMTFCSCTVSLYSCFEREFVGFCVCFFLFFC